MLQGPKTFLSKAWSGASMVAGTNAMVPVTVKTELPDDPDVLRVRIQEPLLHVSLLKYVDLALPIN